MTVAQQVAHAAQTLDWFVNGASRPEGFDLDFAKHAQEVAAVTSLAAARQWLDKGYANAIDFFNSRSPEELAKPLPAGPVMGGMPISDIAWAMIEHTAHHRGALTVYSRMLGKMPVMPYAGIAFRLTPLAPLQMQSGGGRFEAENKVTFHRRRSALFQCHERHAPPLGLSRPSSLLRNGRVDLKAAMSGNGISTLPKGSRLY